MVNKIYLKKSRKSKKKQYRFKHNLIGIDLSTYTYRRLQALAKKHGIKAKGKRDELIRILKEESGVDSLLQGGAKHIRKGDYVKVLKGDHDNLIGVVNDIVFVVMTKHGDALRINGKNIKKVPPAETIEMMKFIVHHYSEFAAGIAEKAKQEHMTDITWGQVIKIVELTGTNQRYNDELGVVARVGAKVSFKTTKNVRFDDINKLKRVKPPVAADDVTSPTPLLAPPSPSPPLHPSRDMAQERSEATLSYIDAKRAGAGEYDEIIFGKDSTEKALFDESDDDHDIVTNKYNDDSDDVSSSDSDSAVKKKNILRIGPASAKHTTTIHCVPMAIYYIKKVH